MASCGHGPCKAHFRCLFNSPASRRITDRVAGDNKAAAKQAAKEKGQAQPRKPKDKLNNKRR